MNNRSVGPATSASSTSTSGSTPASRASIWVCSAFTIFSVISIKKAGGRPLSVLRRVVPAGKAVAVSLAPEGVSRGRFGTRVHSPGPRAFTAPARGRGRSAASVATAAGGAGARLVPILAIVPPAGLQARRQRERAPRLGVAAEQLQAPPQAEQRVVVRRRPVDDRLELGGRLLVAPGAEQRAAERLADRRLVRLEVARPRERNHRLVVVATVEKLGAALEEVVDVVGCHASQW